MYPDHTSWCIGFFKKMNSPETKRRRTLDGSSSPKRDFTSSTNGDDEENKSTTLRKRIEDVLEGKINDDFRKLEDSRRSIYAETLPELERKGEFYVCTLKDDTDQIEHIIRVDEDGKINDIIGECMITWDDVSPSEMVEYRFEDGKWRLAKVSIDALTEFKRSKFELWLKTLKNPSCEAAFKRMLRTGLLTRVFDPMAFPTPEKMKEKYVVVDEKTGKNVQLPHPVEGLRVWNSTSKSYDEISTTLDGAPKTKEDCAKYWASLMTKLEAQHGREYVESLLIDDDDNNDDKS